MFNKNNQNSFLATSQNNVNTSAGFSFLFTEKFDYFSDLFKKRRIKEDKFKLE